VGDGSSPAGTAKLYTNSSTVSLGSGLAGSWGLFVDIGGTFTGDVSTAPSGEHTFGSYINGNSSASITVLTTHANGTIIDSENGTRCFLVMPSCNFDNSNGLVTLTGTHLTSSSTNFYGMHDKHLYDLTINASGITVHAESGFYIDGDLTITAGTLDTLLKAGSSISKNLTVGGVVTINGTLTCNNSTVIFGSAGTKSVDGSGTINCDTATITCSDNFGSAALGLTINMDTASLDIVDRFGDTAGVVVVSGVSEPTINCLRFMKTDLTPGHSTVTLDGNGIYGALGLGAGTFWNVVVDTADGDNKEITSDITIDNDLTITAGGLDTTTDDYDPTILGNFTLGSGCEYLTNDSVTTIKGNWINNGGNVG